MLIRYHWRPLLISEVLIRRTSDPLVHHGHHFGQTVHAMYNAQALLTNGIIQMSQGEEVVEESLTPGYSFPHTPTAASALRFIIFLQG